MAKEALDFVVHKIEKEIDVKNIAAIVIEPIQGEGGFIVPPKGFLAGLVEFAKKNGIIFIADECKQDLLELATCLHATLKELCPTWSQPLKALQADFLWVE